MKATRNALLLTAALYLAGGPALGCVGLLTVIGVAAAKLFSESK